MYYKSDKSEKKQCNIAFVAHRSLQKSTRVDSQLYQATISPELKLDKEAIKQSLETRKIYQHDKLSSEQIEEYLQFIDWLMGEKQKEGLLLGNHNKELQHQKALNFLAQTGYNPVKAKFFITFPCLYYTSSFYHQQLTLTDQQMQNEIDNHLDSMRNNKVLASQRWRQNMQQLLRRRSHLSKIQNLIDQAKSSKFQIPEGIKEEIDQVIKLSRQIKRLIISKNSYEQLQSKISLACQSRIVTNQFIQLNDISKRIEHWRNKSQSFVKTYFIQKEKEVWTVKRGKNVPWKQLSGLTNQYINLPIYVQQFQNTALSLFNQANTLIDRLVQPPFPKTNKGRQKTQSNNNIQILNAIKALQIECDQFEAYKSTFQQGCQQIQRLSMHLQDNQKHWCKDQFLHFSRQLGQLNLGRKLSSQYLLLYQYFNQVERIKKQLVLNNKQALLLLQNLRKKGFRSDLLRDLNQQANEYKNWIQKAQQILDRSTTVEFVCLIDSEILKSLVPESTVLELIAKGEKLSFHSTSVQQKLCSKFKIFKEISNQVQNLLLQPQLIRVSLLIELLKRLLSQGIVNDVTTRLWNVTRNSLTILGRLSWFCRQNRKDERCFLSLQQQKLVLQTSTMNFSAAQLSNLIKACEEYPFLQRQRQFQNCKYLLQLSNSWRQSAQKLLSLPFNRRQEEQLVRLMSIAAQTPGFSQVNQRLSMTKKVMNWQKVVRFKIQNKNIQINPRLVSEAQQLTQKLSTFQRSGSRKIIKQQAIQFLVPLQTRLLEMLGELSLLQLPERSFKLSQLQKLSKQFKQLQKDLDHQQALSIINPLNQSIQRIEQLKKYDLLYKDKSAPFEYYFKFPLLIAQLIQGISTNPALDDLFKIKARLQQLLNLSSRIDSNKTSIKVAIQFYQQIQRVNIFLPKLMHFKRWVRYHKCWTDLANRIINSVPILIHQFNLVEDDHLLDKTQLAHQQRLKRKIKPPSAFSSDQIALLTQQILPKPKKKRKVEPKASQRYFEQPILPYCNCQRGQINANIFWTACDRCKRWFHNECLFIKPTVLKNISYVCQGCCLRTSEQYSQELSYFSPWYDNYKVSEQIWLKIYQQGQSLPLKMKQVQLINIIEEERKNFICKAILVLQACSLSSPNLQLDSEELDSQLALLIAKSIWLPIQNIYQEQLLKYLRQRDLSRQFNKALNSRSKKALRRVLQKDDEDPSALNESLRKKANQKLIDLQKQKMKLDSIENGYGSVQINGLTYRGLFINNQLVGQGTVTNALTNQLVYKGQFKDNKYHGKGIHFNSERTHLPQNFIFQKLNFASLGNSWVRYQGEFQRGKRQGYGQIFLDEELSFIGHFRQGQANGQGIFMRSGVEICRGIWKKNKST